MTTRAARFPPQGPPAVLALPADASPAAVG